MSATQILFAASLEAYDAIPFKCGKAGENFLTVASHIIGYAAAMKKYFKF